MSRRMTPQQQQAVETLVGDVAISAGAGSGKTTVLAHRFAHALKADERSSTTPAAIDRILTITFTNKAAGEIAERARRVVNAEVSVEDGRRIDEAWISTIHTLCGRLIRRHILESDLEPGFAMADDVATALLMAESFERAAAELHGSHTGAAELLETWESPQLRDAVSGAHANIRAMGLDPATAQVPTGLEWVDDLRRAALEAGERFKIAIAGCTQSKAVTEKAERLTSWCDAYAACALNEDTACDRILDLEDTYDISRLPAETKPAHDEFKKARESVKAALVAGRDHASALQGLEALLRSFSRHYAALKADAGCLDFDDLQERAVALLERHPDVAARYREHFRLLMIDEFQDTNDLQMRVLSKIRNDNLCVVGDERQAIYGFRYADVEIFESTRAQMGVQVELKDNFRSHEGVLGLVNEAFSQAHLFGAEFMQLAARRTEGWKLRVPVGEPRVECIFAGSDGTSSTEARELEAELIATRVQNLLADGSVKRGDIAILLRAASHASVYAKALERHAVPTLVTAGAGLFDVTETDEVKALLRAIAVPGDDQALVTLLAGRMVRLSDDALLALRCAGAGGSLWDALRASATSALGGTVLPPSDADAALHAYNVLEWFGTHQGRLRPGELLRRACEAFDYDLTLLSAGPSGIRAWANVLKLARSADAFEAAESRDIAAFVDHLGQRTQTSRDKAAASEAGDEAVRIMTVHAAKGLEFPVVFVADLGTAKERAVGPLLVTRGGTQDAPVAVIGVKLPASTYGAAATALHSVIAASESQRRVEEEKRCLYVACTRAEELLFVSGVCRLEKDAAEGRGLIDWIREAVGDADEHGIARGVTTPVLVTAVDAADELPLPVAQAEEPVARDAIFAPGAFEPAGAAARAPEPPRAVSFSALSLHSKCPLAYHAVYTLHLSRFREPGAPGSTEFGSAVHGVLQVTGASRVSTQAVAAAAARYALDAADAARLESAVNGFVHSELGVRAHGGARVGKEVPLRVRLGPSVLQGNIDLISWDGLSALVVDYKTGKAPSGGDDRRDAAYQLQAQCYALAALESGAEDVEVAFCFVEHGCRAVTFRFTRDDVERVRSELERRVQSIVDDEITHLATYDAGVCEQCPALGGICPIDRPEPA